MRALTGILFLALAGCAAPADVMQTSPEMYRVRPTAGGVDTRNDSEIKAFGIKRANEFCDAQGKHAVITIGQSAGWNPFAMQTAEVHFSCDDKPIVKAPAKGTTP